ncbi:hypothetical protein HQR03_13875 [Psychrobacter okhotskensis]|jgi:hypothetical protein|uniref:hypothetical protein n=1 Tax=Psychrobacter okhotskensis TaxID=212403 RepID=UPI0015656FDB|nr:hypothetical protein [Psychrobacter okhotskensis]NRD71620.1 hypothetical protein [Psychrobacter okhotskensis]
MKKLAIIALTFLAPIAAYANECNYDALSGTEYRITDKVKPYVLLDFMVNPDKDKFGFGQRNERKYQSLKDNPFKVLSTDYVTAESSVYTGRRASKRYKEVVNDGKAYTLDQNLNIELLTSDCVKYYHIPNGNQKSFDSNFQKTDGSANNTQDFLAFLGKSLQPAKIKSTTTYDEFDKQYEIKTDFFKDQMIRAYLDSKEDTPSVIQVYMKVSFLDKWGFIETAKDKSGTTHEVTSIDKEADCSGKSLGLGCMLKETLGVTVDEGFLRKNTTGFELKLSGKQSKVVFVSGELVTAFLDELDSVKKK